MSQLLSSVAHTLPVQCCILPKKPSHCHDSTYFPFLSFDCRSSSCLRRTEHPLRSMNRRTFRLHGSLSLSLVWLTLSLLSMQTSLINHFRRGTTIEIIPHQRESISRCSYPARWFRIHSWHGWPRRSGSSATESDEPLERCAAFPWLCFRSEHWVFTKMSD